MKTKQTLLIFFLLLFANNLSAFNRDALVGTYIYSRVTTQYFPPPETYSYGSGIFYIIKSTSDTNIVIFVDSASGSSKSYIVSSDSSFNYVALPVEQDYATLYPSDTLRISNGYYSAGFGLYLQTIYYGHKISSLTPVNEIAFKNSFLLSPNPANEKLTITTRNDYKNLKAEVYNSQGQKVFEKEDENFNSSFQIDVAEYKQGIYFLKLSYNSQSHYSKFVVQH